MQKVNLTEKELHAQRPGKPKSASDNFKLIKVRSGLYFRLLDLKETMQARRRRRVTFNCVISELLEGKAKNSKVGD